MPLVRQQEPASFWRLLLSTPRHDTRNFITQHGGPAKKHHKNHGDSGLSVQSEAPSVCSFVPLDWHPTSSARPWKRQ